MRNLGPLVPTADLRKVRPAAKTVDPFYLTDEYRAWRSGVIRRAGGRCQWVDHGIRCEKSEGTGDRMFADHVRERKDDYLSAFDPFNGMCLCGSHHSLKTAHERAKRNGAALPGRTFKSF